MPQKLHQVIAKLNGIVLNTQREVDRLADAQRALRLRAVSAEVALMHCTALLRLAALRGDPLAAAVLPAPSGGSGTPAGFGEGGESGGGGGAAPADSSSTSGGGELAGDSACTGGTPAPAAKGGSSASSASVQAVSSPAAATLQELQSCVREMLGELEAAAVDGAGGCGADPAGATGAPGGAGGRDRSRAMLFASAGLPFELKRSWDPERAAANADRHDVSPMGIRAKIISLTQSFGPLLFRVRNGARDAEAAAKCIEAKRTEGLEFAALIRSHAGAEPVLDTHLAPVLADPGDGMYPMGPPPTSHFEFAVEQMELTPEQEELAVIHLSAWKERAEALIARRDAVLARCRDAADAGAGEESVAEVEFLQTTYLLVHAAYDLGFNGTLISPVQFAALLVASFPYIPSPPAVLEALLQVRAAREAKAAVEGSGSGGGSGAVESQVAPKRAR